MDEAIREGNRAFWNATADQWIGVTALPEYGVFCPTEEELHLFGDVRGKKLLEIGCGSGHSLLYQAERGAGELWGLDISAHQLAHARELLLEHGHEARLILSPMEEDCGLPDDYFDIVYSIYAVGWTIDLKGTFRRLAAYLRRGGRFIFSWKHPLDFVTALEGDRPVFQRPYFDEDWHPLPFGDTVCQLASRRISTYVNALGEAGFRIERLVEQTDEKTLKRGAEADARIRKAQLIPKSLIFSARKE